MIDTGAIRKKILHLAVQGALTERAFDDGDAAVLLQAAKEDRALLIKDGIVKKEKPFPDIKDEQKRFDLPVGWTWCYLNEIAFVTKLAGFEYTKYIAEAITTDGIPLFKGKNIQNSNIVLEFESFIPEEVSDSLKRSQLTRKCLLTPYVGTIGNIAIFDGSFKAHLGSNVGKIELFNYSGMHILDEYICYYLKSDYGYLELTKHKKATAQDSISIDAIRDVIVPLPPLAEQQRIVERVESIFSLLDEIDEAQHVYQTNVIKLRQRLINEAIQGKMTKSEDSDESVDELLKLLSISNTKGKKRKQLEAIDTEEIPFAIPEKWRWVRLQTICSKIVDGDHNPPTGLKNKSDYIMVSAQNINNDELCNLDNVRYLDKESFALSNKRTAVEIGDILLTIVATIGRSCVYQGGYNLSFQRSVSVIRTEINNQYLKYVFDSEYIQNYMKNHATGSAQPGFYLNQVERLCIPVPPLAEQKRIVDKLNELLPLCS